MSNTTTNTNTTDTGATDASATDASATDTNTTNTNTTNTNATDTTATETSATNTGATNTGAMTATGAPDTSSMDTSATDTSATDTSATDTSPMTTTTANAATTDGITNAMPANDRCTRKKPGLIAELRAAWRRWRGCSCRGGWFFTVALACCALTACDTTNSSTTGTAIGAACPPASGSVSLAWSIASTSGQALSCSAAGAQSVTLRLRSRTGAAPVFTAFPCADAQGVATVPSDLYDVAIELHDANGARLATVPEQTAVAVAAGRTKPLAPVRFTVGQSGGGNPTGSVRLTLQAQGFTSNCQPASADGAAISSTTITLEASDGGCAPVTFIRNEGGSPIGSYQINCSSPAIATCIEKSEILTSPDLTPGTYVMHVRGKQGAIDCWAGDSTLVVPRAGQPPLQQRIFLQHQPGC